eukprot:933328-Rhodomonas_salina.2
MEGGRWGCALCKAGVVLCKACARAGRGTEHGVEGEEGVDAHVRALRPLEGFLSDVVVRKFEAISELQPAEHLADLSSQAESYLQITQMLHTTLDRLESASPEAAGFEPVLRKLEEMHDETLASVLRAVKSCEETVRVFRQAHSVKTAAHGTSKARYASSSSSSSSCILPPPLSLSILRLLAVFTALATPPPRLALPLPLPPPLPLPLASSLLVCRASC